MLSGAPLRCSRTVSALLSRTGHLPPIQTRRNLCGQCESLTRVRQTGLLARRRIPWCHAAAESEPEGVTDDGGDVSGPASPQTARRGGGGRPARRSNPLGHSILLSSYNASALRQAMDGAPIALEQLSRRMGYSFAHKEIAALALFHPKLTASVYNASALTHSHLALLGEELLRLAAVELVWSATEEVRQQQQQQQQLAGANAANAAATTGSAGDGGEPTLAAGSPWSLLIESALTGAVTAVLKWLDSAAAVAAPTPAPAPQQQATATLLNKAAAAALAAVAYLAEEWQVEAHMVGFHTTGTPPGKQEKLTCTKALVAALYLDGGYAGAVRKVLAPFVAEILRGPDGDVDPDVKEAGHLLALWASPQRLAAGADDLHAVSGPRAAETPTATSAAGAAATASSSLVPLLWGGDVPAVVSADGLEEDAEDQVEAVVRRLHGPPPYTPTSPAVHAQALLQGLRVHGEGYQPQSLAGFLAMCDPCYGYLDNYAPGASLAAQPLPRGEARQRHITDSVVRARAMFMLGRAVYGVVVSELALERGVAAAADPETRYTYGDNKVRRAAVDELRRGRDELMADRLRCAQVEAGLGLRRRNGVGGLGAPEEGSISNTWGAEGGEGGVADWGPYGNLDAGEGAAVVPGNQASLARFADGVVAAVALEGGMRHARAVVRGLVGAGEVVEAVRHLEEQLG